MDNGFGHGGGGGRVAGKIAEACAAHARKVCALFLVAGVLMAAHAGRTLVMDTDDGKLISSELPFRKAEREIGALFGSKGAGLVAVIDAPVPALAEEAVEKLRAVLAAKASAPGFPIASAERPSEEIFFRRHGLLFLGKAEIEAATDGMVRAQPMLATVAADPSARALFASVGLVLKGVELGQGPPDAADALARAIDGPTAEAAEGRAPKPVDWLSMTARTVVADSSRRFLLISPRKDFSSLEASGSAARAVKAAAEELGLAGGGYRVRVTGEAALADANFATVGEGMLVSGPLSLLLVGLLLLRAVRSWRAAAAIGLSLLFGLVATADFAAFAVGSINPVSAAFAVLFVGIAVDFGIQFAVAHQEAMRAGLGGALERAARRMAVPLGLAACATAAGFFSFLPTDYTGVSQLGLIAGAGMIVALACDFTLLPALLALLSPKPVPSEPRPALLRADAFLERNAKAVVAVGLILALAGGASAALVRLDFDPLRLQDSRQEAVAAFQELAAEPEYGVHSLSTAAPAAQAKELAARLESLPEVRRVGTPWTFIPEEQEDKAALLSDTAAVLAVSLSPLSVRPPPDAEDLRAAAGDLSGRIDALSAKSAADAGKTPAPSKALLDLSSHLKAAVRRGDGEILALDKAIAGGFPNVLKTISTMLDVGGPISLETLPEDLRRAHVSADGRRVLLEIHPKGDMADPLQRRRFVEAVAPLVPRLSADASQPLLAGTPVAVESAGKTVVGAFAVAGCAAVVLNALLLAGMLRNAKDAALVILPLLAGAAWTAPLMLAADVAINFADIIALPPVSSLVSEVHRRAP